MIEEINNTSQKLSKTGKPFPQELVEVNPDCHIPCIRHGTFGVWESGYRSVYTLCTRQDGRWSTK